MYALSGFFIEESNLLAMDGGLLAINGGLLGLEVL